MLSFRFWYSAYCDSFLRSLFHLTVVTSMSQHFPFGFQLISHGLRFRFRIVGFEIFSLSRLISAVFLGCFPSSSLILTSIKPLVNNFFTIFYKFFKFFQCNRLLFNFSYLKQIDSNEKVQFPGPQFIFKYSDSYRFL